MRLFLDCEFNGHGGQLISMALVAEDGREWYEVLPCYDPCDWVAENVMPILGKPALQNMRVLTESLRKFLLGFESVHIVADWPADIMYFARVLLVDDGSARINTPPLTMEILRVDGVSAEPHNALADARGIRDAVIAGERA